MEQPRFDKSETTDSSGKKDKKPERSNPSASVPLESFIYKRVEPVEVQSKLSPIEALVPPLMQLEKPKDTDAETSSEDDDSDEPEDAGQTKKVSPQPVEETKTEPQTAELSWQPVAEATENLRSDQLDRPQVESLQEESQPVTTSKVGEDSRRATGDLHTYHDMPEAVRPTFTRDVESVKSHLYPSDTELMSVPAPHFEQQEEAQQALASGGATPPKPPVPPAESGAFYDQPPEREPYETQNWHANWAQPVEASTYPAAVQTLEKPNFHRQQEQNEARKSGTRFGLVAGFITGVVVANYLKNKGQKETAKQIERLAAGQAEAGSRVDQYKQELERQKRFSANQPAPNRFEQTQSLPPLPEIKPIQKPYTEQVPGEQPRESEQPIELKPHQHLEHSAWHNIVVDEHGREIPGAIHYGQAFQQERSRESTPQILQNQAISGRAAVGVSVGLGRKGDGLTYSPTADDQGQPPSDQNMVLGQGLQDGPSQTRQQSKRNQVVSALASPWLWLAVGILLIAFFAAATI